MKEIRYKPKVLYFIPDQEFITYIEVDYAYYSVQNNTAPGVLYRKIDTKNTIKQIMVAYNFRKKLNIFQ